MRQPSLKRQSVKKNTHTLFLTKLAPSSSHLFLFPRRKSHRLSATTAQKPNKQSRWIRVSTPQQKHLSESTKWFCPLELFHLQAPLLPTCPWKNPTQGHAELTWRSWHTIEGRISLGALVHGPENHFIQAPSFGELGHTSDRSMGLKKKKPKLRGNEIKSTKFRTEEPEWPDKLAKGCTKLNRNRFFFYSICLFGFFLLVDIFLHLD